MTKHHYQNNQLFLEQVNLEDLASTIKTPFYCYSQRQIEQQYLAYRNNLSGLDALVCYAVKANSNQAVIKLLADLGAGADVVTSGELRRALQAGIPADRIVYSGVAKTRDDIRLALESDILQFNVESINELKLINKVATELNTSARIALRINPDVDAQTHEKISTGKAENKFGIPIQDAPMVYQLAAGMQGIQIQGVDMHIGSQLTRLTPFRTAFELLLELVTDLRAAGHPISHIDVGGGLGINYQEDNGAPTIADYCQQLSELLSDWDGKVIVEPGRSIVAEAGLLVSSVIYIKEGHERTFCILDAAMNDLARPSIYNALHNIIPVNESSESQKYDVVGPVCETGDTFARDYTMARLNEGDLVAFTCVGGYGAVMSSTYNTRQLIPEVLIKDDQYHVIRKRPTYDELIGLDDLPQW